jgi:hypothetical protein
VNAKGDPARRLSIEVRAAKPLGTVRSEMVIRDVTPPPVEPGLTDEQRWQKAGLSPSGAVLAPQKLE